MARLRSPCLQFMWPAVFPFGPHCYLSFLPATLGYSLVLLLCRSPAIWLLYCIRITFRGYFPLRDSNGLNPFLGRAMPCAISQLQQRCFRCLRWQIGTCFDHWRCSSSDACYPSGSSHRVSTGSWGWIVAQGWKQGIFSTKDGFIYTQLYPSKTILDWGKIMIRSWSESNEDWTGTIFSSLLPLYMQYLSLIISIWYV